MAWFPGDGNALDLQGGDSGTFNPTAVTFAPGKVAQAFQFNGGGEVTVADQPALDVTTALTLDAWVSPAAAGGSIVFKGNGGTFADGTTSGTPTTTVIDDSGVFGFPSGDFSKGPDINNAGRVAFFATLDAGGEGIFATNVSGGMPTTIATANSGGFLYFYAPAINDAGTVAFRAAGGGAEEGIYTAPSTGGQPTPVADTSGAFAFFVNVAVNNVGTLAFLAARDIGGEGIFTGPDPVNDRVIATGDPLFCSTVTSVTFLRDGLNDSGQVTFQYYLADNRSGIAIASPVLLLTGAVSSKMHGALGPYDINLLTNPAGLGVECRSTGGSLTLVFRFTNAIVSGNVSLTSGAGTVSGSPTVAGNTLTVELTGVSDIQQLTLSLSNITDVFANVLPTSTVQMNVLRGDVNGDKTVNSGDSTVTRSRSGQTTDALNFRADMNRDGSINGGDVLVVRNASGNGLP